MGVFVWFFVPETKGMQHYSLMNHKPKKRKKKHINPTTTAGISLEKMDDLFGVTDHLNRKLADPEHASANEDSKGGATETRIEKV